MLIRLDLIFVTKDCGFHVIIFIMALPLFKHQLSKHTFNWNQGKNVNLVALVQGIRQKSSIIHHSFVTSMVRFNVVRECFVASFQPMMKIQIWLIQCGKTCFFIPSNSTFSLKRNGKISSRERNISSFNANAGSHLSANETATYYQPSQLSKSNAATSINQQLISIFVMKETILMSQAMYASLNLVSNGQWRPSAR